MTERSAGSLFDLLPRGLRARSRSVRRSRGQACSILETDCAIQTAQSVAICRAFFGYLTFDKERMFDSSEWQVLPEQPAGTLTMPAKPATSSSNDAVARHETQRRAVAYDWEPTNELRRKFFTTVIRRPQPHPKVIACLTSFTRVARRPARVGGAATADGARHFSSEPAVTSTVAAVPMPLPPPWISTDSPSRAFASWKTVRKPVRKHLGYCARFVVAQRFRHVHRGARVDDDFFRVAAARQQRHRAIAARPDDALRSALAHDVARLARGVGR